MGKLSPLITLLLAGFLVMYGVARIEDGNFWAAGMDFGMALVLFGFWIEDVVGQKRV